MNSEERRDVGDPLNDSEFVFSFFWQCTVQKLRGISKKWNMRVSGNKTPLISRALLRAKMMKGPLGSLKDFLMKVKGSQEKVHAFRKQIERRPEMMFRAPKNETLLAQLSKEEAVKFQNVVRKMDDGSFGSVPKAQTRVVHDLDGTGYEPNEHQGVTMPFSVNEFARLVVILRDDQRARDAAQKATQYNLTRSQLDQGQSRDSFWNIVVERFNNANVVYGIDLRGRIDDVDCAALPKVHRSAARLRKAFKDGQKSFSMPLFLWQKSGENDPDHFPVF